MSLPSANPRPQGRGTGNILQDLLSSSVNLTRVTNYRPESQQVSQDKIGQPVSTPVTLNDNSCSICGVGSEKCQPLTLEETQILMELDSCPLTSESLCPTCSKTLEELAKLKERIQVITQCLRALLRIQLQKHCTTAVHESVTPVNDQENEKMDNQDSCKSTITPHAIELELTDVDDTDEELEGRRNEIESEELQCTTITQNECDTEPGLVMSVGREFIIKPDPEDSEWDDEVDMKPIVCDMDIDLMEVEGEEINMEDDAILPPRVDKMTNAELKEHCTVQADGKIVCNICKTQLNARGDIWKFRRHLWVHFGASDYSFKSGENSSQKQNGSDVIIPGENKMTNEELKEYCTIQADGKIICNICDTKLKAYGDIGKFRRHLINHAHSAVPDLGNTDESAEVENVMEVRTKRKSAARAEELLHSLLTVECNDKEEESDSDASASIDEDESDSSYENNSRQDFPRIKTPVDSDLPVTSFRDPLQCDTRGHKAPDLENSNLHKSQKCNVRSTLKEHLLRKRPSAKFADATVVDNQIKNKLNSDSCEMITISQKAEDKSKLQHKGGDEKTFRCGPCNKNCKSASDLKEHCLTKKHAANLGGSAFDELESKKKHKCDGCEMVFVSRKVMRKHRLRHLGLFTCDKCGKQLSTLEGFKHHMTHVHSGKPKKTPRPPNRFIDPKDKQFLCKLCDKRFVDKGGLWNHMRATHQRSHNFNCDLCPKEFNFKSKLHAHKKNVHGDGPKVTKKSQKVSCDICLVSIHNKPTLMVHIELKHFPDKVRCPYGCPEQFANELEWTSHLEQCQSEKLTESSKCYCNFCREIFPTHLLRIAHHLRVHESFPCEVCSRSFTRREVRNLHNVKEHKQVKPFLCAKCGKGFRQPINLHFHSTTVCGDDEAAKKELLAKRREQHRNYRQKAKPHKCDKCSKTFVEERRLEDHKKKVHLNNQDKSSASDTDEEVINEGEIN